MPSRRSLSASNTGRQQYIQLRDVLVVGEERGREFVRIEFDEVADGNVNALTAALRGMLGIEGDPAVLVRFQRLFPAGEPKREAGSSARTVGRQRS